MAADVSTEGLADLSRALTNRRLDYIKLLDTLNAAPRGLSDLVAQSRAFTEKLAHLLEGGSELSDAVKNELVDDNGFPGHVRRLPLEEIYGNIERVKEELRVADGYQPYLVAPEAGLRSLFENSVGTLVNPVRDLVDSVHGIVSMAADRAMKEACQVASLGRGPPVVRFPNFIEAVLPVAMEGLEELKDEAMKMAVRVVEMEQGFVSCSFFRYLTFKRIQEVEEAKKERDAQNGRRRPDDEDDSEDDDNRSFAETEVSLPPLLPGDSIPNVYASPELVFGLSGYLEKSSTHSRNKFTQFESSLWQRRFFGIRDDVRTLEYYYSEQAFLKGTLASVVIQLSDCVVSDTDGQGVLPQSTLSKSTDHLNDETEISLLVCLRNRDPDKPIYKNSKDLILRADDAADKYRWLSYLKTMTSDSRTGARVATWSPRAVPKSRMTTDSGVAQGRGEHVIAEDYGGLQEGHGLGHSIFWDPICRDTNNGLMPSPGILLDDDTELSMDKALVQHAADMRLYTRLACETLVMTVPKVIVHCLVDRATERLSPLIEEHILRMSGEQRDLLLEEDAGIAGHRRRVQDLVSDIGKAQDKLKELERGMGEAVSVKVDVAIIELAGLSGRLKQNEEGIYIFINKPKPPTAKRNVTPEKTRESVPPRPPQAAPSHSPSPPQTGSSGRAPPSRALNGAAPPGLAPRRNPPSAPPLAATRSNGGIQQPPQRPQPPKAPQGGSWYGFKPFGR